MKKNKYMIYSHNDLDGYSVNTICKYYRIDADIKNINNKVVDQELMKFFINKCHLNYDKVFLVDTYINEETAIYINSNIKNFVLLDHHKTGEFLNKYSWANVIVKQGKVATCGASLFYDYFVKNGLIKETKIMDQYIESVRLFDTGEYLNAKHKKEYIPDELNCLFYLYFKHFPGLIAGNMGNGKLLNSSDKTTTNALLSKMKIYAMNKSKEVISIDFEGYKVGVLFIEDSLHINNTLKICSEHYPDYDFFMFINILNSISLRTFKNIDLAKIASSYGGGGHFMAAGFPYNKELVLKILKEK